MAMRVWLASVFLCLGQASWGQTCAEVPTQACVFAVADAAIAEAQSPEEVARLAATKANILLSAGDPEGTVRAVQGHMAVLPWFMLADLGERLAQAGRMDLAIPVFDALVQTRLAVPPPLVLDLLFDADTRQRAGDLAGAKATRQMARDWAATQALPERLADLARVALVQALSGEGDQARATLALFDETLVDLADGGQAASLAPSLAPSLANALRVALLLDDRGLVTRFDTDLGPADTRLIPWAAAGRLDDFAALTGSPAPDAAARDEANTEAAASILLVEREYLAAISPDTIARMMRATDAMSDQVRAGQLVAQAMVYLAGDGQFDLAASLAPRISDPDLRLRALGTVAGQVAGETGDATAAVALLPMGDAGGVPQLGSEENAHLIGRAFLDAGQPDLAAPWLVQAHDVALAPALAASSPPTHIIRDLARLQRADLIDAYLAAPPDDAWRMGVLDAWADGAIAGGFLEEAAYLVTTLDTLARAQLDEVDPAMADAAAAAGQEVPTPRDTALQALARTRADLALAQVQAGQVEAAMATLDGIALARFSARAYWHLAAALDRQGKAQVATGLRQQLLDLIAAGGLDAPAILQAILQAEYPPAPPHNSVGARVLWD